MVRQVSEGKKNRMAGRRDVRNERKTPVPAHAATPAPPDAQPRLEAANPQPVQEMGSSSSRRPAGFRLPTWLNAYLAAAIASPFLILLADRNAFFTRPGDLDPWVYRGYFTHFSEFIGSWFPGTYYGSRLSWIVPGWIVNALFSPLIANYVLHFAVYYLGALSLYYVLNHFYGAQAALVGSIAFTTCPYVWDAVGWDYVDGAGIGYYLCLVALIIRARQRPRWVAGALAGMVCSALLYTNIVWVVLIPLPVGIYLLAPSPPATTGTRFRATAAFLTSFAAGGLALTLALCIINYRAGGAFLFYAPSISYVLRNASDASGRYQIEGRSWLWQATWLIYPSMALLVSVICCIRRFFQRAGRAVDYASMFHYQLIGAVLIILACEAKGMYFLEYQYYASYLIPFTFLALGCEIFSFKGCKQPVWAIAAAAILFLPWSPAGPRIWTTVSGAGAASILVMVAAGAIIGSLWQGRASAVVAAAGALCLLNMYLLDRTGKFTARASAPDARRQLYERIAEASRFIDQQRGARRAVFWFDRTDANSYDFDSINSVYLWRFSQMGRQFPNLDEELRDRVVRASMIVVLSTERDVQNVLSEASRALGSWHLSVALHASMNIGGQDTGYHVICLDLHRSRAGEDATQTGRSMPSNLAFEKIASQSSTEAGAVADNAVDGDTDGEFADGSVTHTKIEDHAWWQVDLGASAAIDSIVIWNRTDAVSERLADYWVFVSDRPFAASDTPVALQRRAGTSSSHQAVAPNPATTIRTNGIRGRYVRVQLNGKNYLSLAEVQVF